MVKEITIGNRTFNLCGRTYVMGILNAETLLHREGVKGQLRAILLDQFVARISA